MSHRNEDIFDDEIDEQINERQKEFKNRMHFEDFILRALDRIHYLMIYGDPFNTALSSAIWGLYESLPKDMREAVRRKFNEYSKNGTNKYKTHLRILLNAMVDVFDEYGLLRRDKKMYRGYMV